MEIFNELLGKLSGIICLIICGSLVFAVFVVTLMIMLIGKKKYPLGIITSFATIFFGLICYFAVLSGADAAYATGDAVVILLGGALLSLIGAIVAAAVKREAKAEAKATIVIAEEKPVITNPIIEPINQIDEPEQEPTEEIPLADDITDVNEQISEEAEPEVPDAVEPQPEQPAMVEDIITEPTAPENNAELTREEVIAKVRAAQESRLSHVVQSIETPKVAVDKDSLSAILLDIESGAQEGITMQHAKDVIARISKLKAMPEYDNPETRKQLIDAQRKLVQSIKK